LKIAEANEADTSLKLFQAVSEYCFIFTSECADVWNKTEIKQCCSVVGLN